MTTIAQRIIGGVDIHKDVHVAAVLDELGRLIEVASFPTDRHGYTASSPGCSPTATSTPSASKAAGRGAQGSPATSPPAESGCSRSNRPNRQERRRLGKDDAIDAEAAARAVIARKAKVIPKSGDGPIEATAPRGQERR